MAKSKNDQRKPYRQPNPKDHPEDLLKAKKDLTYREQRFVRNYCNSANGTQSYIDSGYKVKNRQVAATEASRMLRKPHIQYAIQERTAYLAQHGPTMTGDEIVEQLSEIAWDRQNTVQERIVALDKLAKINQLYEDKAQHEPIQIQIATSSEVLAEHVDIPKDMKEQDVLDLPDPDFTLTEEEEYESPMESLLDDGVIEGTFEEVTENDE